MEEVFKNTITEEKDEKLQKVNIRFEKIFNSFSSANKETIIQVESELDSEILIENYLSKKEYKYLYLLTNDLKVKFIKHYEYKFHDGNIRKLIVSKTIHLERKVNY